MPTINVPLDRITPNPWQTRLRLQPEHVLPLAEDIARNGLLHPPAGRLLFDGDVFKGEQPPEILGNGWTVQLAVGHNRAAAYDVLAYGPAHRFPEFEGHVDGPDPDPSEFGAIPVQIGAYSDQQMASLAWAENAQRKDLTPLEEARAIEKAIDSFGWTQAEAAEHFGLARATVANKLRLLHLPDDVQGFLHQGRISERAASSMLPIYGLPQEVRDKIRDADNFYYNEAEILKAAEEGKSSDEIRTRVERAISGATESLDRHPFPLDEAVAANLDGVRSASCNGCALRVVHGDEQRCGDGHCATLKSDWWKSHRLALAHEATGLPVTDRETWACTFFEEHDERGLDNKRFGPQILADGCPDERLSLVFKPHYWGRDTYHVEEMPDVLICCAATGGCACLSKRKRAEEGKPEVDPQEIAAEQAKKRWHEEVHQPLVERLAGALETMSPDAWRAVVASLVYGIGKHPDWDGFCAAVARHMVDKKTPWDAVKQFESSRRELLQWFADAGIPAVEPAEPADDLRRRLQRINRWADDLAHTYPTVEQLRGNLQNLEQIVADFWEVAPTLAPDGEPGDHEKSDPLDYFLAEQEMIEGLIEELLPIVEGEKIKLVDFYEHMPTLLSSEPGELEDLVADAAVDLPLLQYARAIALYRNDNRRVRALELPILHAMPNPAHFPMCDECNDLLPGDELISCSCDVRICENCYVELGHRAHDTSPTNAALREIMDGFNQS